MNKSNNKNLRDVQHALQNDFEKIKDAFAETSEDIKKQAGKLLTNSYDGIVEKSSDAQDNVADYVAKKPFKSLSIALLSGVVLGLFLRR